MRLRFTHHAQSQLFARNVPASYIADTIRSPESSSSAAGGAMLYRRSFSGKILEVVCVKGKIKNEYLILTAYYL